MTSQLIKKLVLLKKKIFEAVQKNLVSDVPVEVAFLSGGLDSSAIIGIMDHFKSPIDSKISTFSMRFPSNDEINEEKYAEIIANHFNAIIFQLQQTMIFLKTPIIYYGIQMNLLVFRHNI